MWTIKSRSTGAEYCTWGTSIFMKSSLYLGYLWCVYHSNAGWRDSVPDEDLQQLAIPVLSGTWKKCQNKYRPPGTCRILQEIKEWNAWEGRDFWIPGGNTDCSPFHFIIYFLMEFLEMNHTFIMGIHRSQEKNRRKTRSLSLWWILLWHLEGFP